MFAFMSIKRLKAMQIIKDQSDFRKEYSSCMRCVMICRYGFSIQGKSISHPIRHTVRHLLLLLICPTWTVVLVPAPTNIKKLEKDKFSFA